MKITSAEFILSATDRAHWPDESLPEIAFLGRSNVGKSSLINCLVSRKNLARVSAAPGRTRMINFFRVNDRLILADLPGYGYARVAREERAKWQEIVESYLTERKELRAAVLILDLRRPPGADERELLAWLQAHGRTALLVATKADKLPRGKQAKARAVCAKALGVEPAEIVLFSSRTREGREELGKRIALKLGQSATSVASQK